MGGNGGSLRDPSGISVTRELRRAGTVAVACEWLPFWKAKRAENLNPPCGHVSGSGTPFEFAECERELHG
jgi:hypothetical protein